MQRKLGPLGLMAIVLLIAGCHLAPMVVDRSPSPEPTDAGRTQATQPATPLPPPTPSEPATVAPTPPGQPAVQPSTTPEACPASPLSTPAAATWRYLLEQQRSGAAVRAVIEGLSAAIAPTGVRAQALAVPGQIAKDPPLFLVTYWPQEEALFAQGHAIFWWQGDVLCGQEWPVSRAGQDPESLPSSVFVAARREVREGRLELGVVYDANAGGSAQMQVFRLLRLENGHWRSLWDGLRDSGRLWKASQTAVSFAPDLGTILVRSSSWQFDDGKGGFFHESNPGPHRYFLDTWQRRGDRYELTSTRVEPSAYATLVEFVYHLSRGEDAEAAKLVTDPALVAQARTLGLQHKPASAGWLIDLNSPEVEQRGPIKIVEGPPVTISFEKRDGAWLIKGIKSSAKGAQSAGQTVSGSESSGAVSS